VNTGWTGGAYGKGGRRFDIPVTRAVVHAVQSGILVNQAHETLPGFNVKVPTHIEGVDAALLNPKKAWTDSTAYDENANILIEQFKNNFTRFAVPDVIKNAGPQ